MTPAQTPAQEKAREILQSLRAINQHMGYEFTQPLMMAEGAITAALIAERQAGREEGLDEAAQVAEIYRMDSLDELPGHIRALKNRGES